jgi:hypothetical protein
MRTAALVLGLLVAAALAGCTGGSDKTSQIPNPFSKSASGTSSGSGGNATDSHPHGPSNATLDAFLNVSASNGTAPLDLTITFGASATQANLTWTLDVTAKPLDDSTGGGSGNATGNQTGNATGNATGNDTTSASSTSTSTGITNSTGNTTGNGTSSPAGNSGGNQTGDQTGSTVVASFNGTGADLPGNRSVWLNTSASVRVDFVVHFDDNSTVERNATVTVTAVPAGTPLGNQTETFDGSFLVSEPVTCVLGSDEHKFTLNATWNGTTAAVDHINATLDEGDLLADFNVTLLDGNGTELASGQDGFDSNGTNGTGFQAGDYVLRVQSCLSADADYTVTLVARYVTV